MERVQITGQAGNGQYYDNKGRLLYAMGDINIVPGMWVWTNGKTIYGHQTAGEQPAPMLRNDVLPFIDATINARGGIGELECSGPSAKPFYSNGGIMAYVGDATHAYVQLYTHEWFNVLTGENLGAFDVDDACIGENGDLLTVKGESGFYDLGANRGMSEIQKFYPILMEDAKLVVPPGRYVTHGWWVEAESVTPYCGYTAVAKPAASFYRQKIYYNPSQDASATIRRNGKIIKKVILTKYAKSIEDVARNLFSRVQNSGTGDDSDPVYAIADHGKIIGYGDPDAKNYGSYKSHEVKLGPRPRPNYDYQVSIDPRELRIHPDESLDGFISVQISGEAYPVFAHTEFAPETYEMPTEYHYAGMKFGVWDFPLWGPVYKYYDTIADGVEPYTDFLVAIPKVRNNNTWITMNVYVDGMIRLTDNKVVAMDQGIIPESCKIPGPPTNDAKLIAKKAPLIPEFNLECTQVAGGAETWLTCERRNYKIVEESKTVTMLDWPAGSGPNGMHYYDKTVSQYHTDTSISNEVNLYSSYFYIGDGADSSDIAQKIKECGAQTYYSKFTRGAASCVFRLNNNYSASIDFDPHSLYWYATSMKIYDKADEIVSIKDLNKFYPFLCYAWPQMRVGKLKNGIYAISLSKESGYYPVIFVKNGKVINDINSGSAVVNNGRIFSMQYFHNRSLLKKRLGNLLNDV